MRITNHTRWRTEEIRAIAQRVAKEELEPWEVKALRLICVPYMNDKRQIEKEIRLFDDPFRNAVQKTQSRYRVVIVINSYQKSKSFARSLAWKLLETQPSTADLFERRKWKRYRDPEHYAWTIAYPLIAKTALVSKTNAKQSIQDHRYQQVLAGIERWTKKADQAKRRLDKLNKKRKYYERILKGTTNANEN